MSECQVCRAETDGFMCKVCLRRLEQDIGDMTSLMHELSLAATRQTNVYRANGRAADGDAAELAEAQHYRWQTEQRQIPPRLRSPSMSGIALPATDLMVNLPAREQLWEAGNTLSTWVRHLAESRGVELPEPSRIVAWLLTFSEAIRFDEAAGEIYDEISYLHGRMMAAVDRSPSRIYAGPCYHAREDAEKCQQSLYAWPSATSVKCDGFRPDGVPAEGCGYEHDIQDREEWMMAEFEDALLPLVVWQDALPKMKSLRDLVWPSRTTWWRWQNTNMLTAKSNTRDGVPTFRGGDVIKLVREEQPRILGARDRKRKCA